MENKNINICKIHKIKMELDGYEKDYRIYHCKLCDLENLNNELGDEEIKKMLSNMRC